MKRDKELIVVYFQIIYNCQFKTFVTDLFTVEKVNIYFTQVVKVVLLQIITQVEVKKYLKLLQEILDKMLALPLHL